ncbi:hypothetical protein B005_3159 [Nocardiopsis alba ATCC BAA-2165]|uniref:Uncharacterized protein n=1 Tax=Nocardiopsis alba (strain ATCC BAA-2165 / BE74) TaxID=1205910 RepID=J7L8E4_NOCAA|nr:hypothetical protein B005_3159 [Nocardiopsis alba ATCC BAA-2165]
MRHGFHRLLRSRPGRRCKGNSRLGQTIFAGLAGSHRRVRFDTSDDVAHGRLAVSYGLGSAHDRRPSLSFV